MTINKAPTIVELDKEIENPIVELDKEIENPLVEDIKGGLTYAQLTKKYGLTKYRITELKRELGLLRDNGSAKKKQVVKETPANDVVIPNPGVSFIFKFDGKKPYKNCYPTEVDGYLAWGVTIHTLEEFLDMVDSFDDNEGLMVYKRMLDVMREVQKV